jgi:DNA-binding LytR/AlgR family response regulator
LQAVSHLPDQGLPHFATQLRHPSAPAQGEVDYFAIEGGLTTLNTPGQRYSMDLSLTDLERRLDPTEFVRVSRECIARIDSIVEVVPMIGGYAEILTRGGQHLEVSRRRLKDLLAKLGAIR